MQLNCQMEMDEKIENIGEVADVVKRHRNTIASTQQEYEKKCKTLA